MTEQPLIERALNARCCDEYEPGYVNRVLCLQAHLPAASGYLIALTALQYACDKTQTARNRYA
jgi:hypothetical protein